MAFGITKSSVRKKPPRGRSRGKQGKKDQGLKSKIDYFINTYNKSILDISRLENIYKEGLVQDDDIEDLADEVKILEKLEIKLKKNCVANWNKIANLVLCKNSKYFDQKLGRIKDAIKLKLVPAKKPSILFLKADDSKRKNVNSSSHSRSKNPSAAGSHYQRRSTFKNCFKRTTKGDGTSTLDLGENNSISKVEQESSDAETLQFRKKILTDFSSQKGKQTRIKEVLRCRANSSKKKDFNSKLTKILSYRQKPVNKKPKIKTVDNRLAYSTRSHTRQKNEPEIVESIAPQIPEMTLRVLRLSKHGRKMLRTSHKFDANKTLQNSINFQSLTMDNSKASLNDSEVVTNEPEKEDKSRIIFHPKMLKNPNKRKLVNKYRYYMQ